MASRRRRAMRGADMIAGLETPDSVLVTVADECAVFLDVGRDRYFKLGRAQTALLQGGASQNRSALIGRLTAKGLVGRADEASRVVSSARDVCRPAISQWVGVLGACAWAHRALKQRSFSGVIAWATQTRPSPQAPAPSEMLIERFRSRRWFYPRDYNCLFDSLALARFLRLRGLAGDWVFGVRGMPFAAHCWIAVDGAPINDDPDFTAPYTQIHIA